MAQDLAAIALAEHLAGLERRLAQERADRQSLELKWAEKRQQEADALIVAQRAEAAKQRALEAAWQTPNGVPLCSTKSTLRNLPAYCVRPEVCCGSLLVPGRWACIKKCGSRVHFSGIIIKQAIVPGKQIRGR